MATTQVTAVVVESQSVPVPTRAEEVLQRIDALWAWLGEVQKKVESRFMELAGNLLEAHRNKYWQIRGYTDESEYISAAFQSSRSQYYRLISIAEHLGHYPSKLLEEIGSTKCEHLVKLQKHYGNIPENYFLHAKAEDRETFCARVKSELAGDIEAHHPNEETQWKSFRFCGDEILEMNELLKLAQKMSGSDKSESEALRLALIDWSTGLRDDGEWLLKGRDGFVLLLIGRLYSRLTPKQETVMRTIQQLNSWVEKIKDEIPCEETP